MLSAAIATLRKVLGVHTQDVRLTPPPPPPAKRQHLESEDDFEDTTLDATEPHPKKRRLHVDHCSAAAADTPSLLSPVLMRLPWFTWAREEVPSPSSVEKMSALRRQKQKEECDEVTVLAEGVSRWHDPAPPSTCLPASLTSQQEDDVQVLARRKARNTHEPPTFHSLPGQSSIADFRFVPSSVPPAVPEPAKTDRDSNCLRSLRSHKFLSTKTRPAYKGHQGSVLDRFLGKRRWTGVLSSRIKRSVVQKSFLHEEKMKYQQLLQQYTEHYLTPPKPNLLSHPDSSFPASPVAMVTCSKWTPLQTKQKQKAIENELSLSSWGKVLPSARNSMLEEVPASKKMVSVAEAGGRNLAQNSSNSVFVPLIDLSKDDHEGQNICDEESDDESVIMIKEVLSPQAQKNSLEERLKEHHLYNQDWIRSLRKEYEDRASQTRREVDTASRVLQELEQRRNKKVSLHDKVTQGLKLLDLSYPSEYTEIRIPDEEEEEAFVPLTQDMENEIDAALTRTPQSQVLIEKFHIQITRRDIRTLDGLNWLNDEVINFYMNLLMERSKKSDKYPSVYTFNTFFYPKLSKSGYQSVRRWTKKVDLFSHDLLLIPVHLGMHWCMSVVNFKTKCISYFDSMLGSNEWCLQSLLEYLESEHQDKKGSPYNTSDWKLENKKDIPQQMNGSDCGMFACKFADYVSRRARINFDQEHMPYFRRRMVYEIINAKLL